VAGSRWRVLNKGVDLLCQLTAILEINQGMPVHIDSEIGMGFELRVERWRYACASRVKLVSRLVRASAVTSRDIRASTIVG